MRHPFTVASFLRTILTENFRHCCVVLRIGPRLVLQVAVLFRLPNDIEQIGIDDAVQIHGLDIRVVGVGGQAERFPQ